MVPLAKQCAFEEPSVETISGENVLTWPHVVSHFCGLSPISYLFSKSYSYSLNKCSAIYIDNLSEYDSSKRRY